MEILMIRNADIQLTSMNRLAEQFQDEAFTLAYYLLGDEIQAAQATQGAFAHLYQHAQGRMDQIRFEVLRWVLQHCRKAGMQFAHLTTSEEIVRQLLFLKEDQRSVIVLVDVLDLDYAEAAQVLHCSRKQIGKLLAQGRLSLTRQSKTSQPLARV
jgi:DNA-directed RNA polymerase specialized sigma24 family protein